MTTDTVSLEFLTRQSRLTMDELRLMRKDLAQMMSLLTANFEQTRRIERRLGELRDDVELTVKMEIGGALANMQTTLRASR